jgi:predicted nuclease of predicted toxin-antitoxin system
VKFLADECCDTSLVASLKKDGHDVLYVLEEKPGVTDDEVLLDAYNERRILITEDKDFGELVYRLKKPAEGIILIRIDVKQRHMKWHRLKKLIEKHEKRLGGHLVVIDTQKFRFRPLISMTE